MARVWGRTVERLCRKHADQGASFNRWLKRRTSKLWRKLAKEDPEMAPTRRPTRGWSD